MQHPGEAVSEGALKPIYRPLNLLLGALKPIYRPLNLLLGALKPIYRPLNPLLGALKSIHRPLNILLYRQLLHPGEAVSEGGGQLQDAACAWKETPEHQIGLRSLARRRFS
jgi:hypothetical protein